MMSFASVTLKFPKGPLEVHKEFILSPGKKRDVKNNYISSML